MTTIFWAGDSTVQQNSILTYPQTGIGQVFDRYIKRCRVQIANHAKNGRSTRSFLEEGRFAPICAFMKAGDFLFIQFGHNDQKHEDPSRYAPADTLYSENLKKMILAARSRGAYPVLITPLTRFNYRELPPDRRHDDWAQAMRRISQEMDVALVDLTRMSEKLVDAYGSAAENQLYMTLPAGQFAAFPQGKSDRTHLQPLGALLFGDLIARGLHHLGGIYRDLLDAETIQWLENTAGQPIASPLFPDIAE